MDFDAAEALYKRATEVEPENPIGLVTYASFAGEVRKDHVTAEALYKRAIRVDPKNPNYLAGYARLCFVSGDKETGARLLELALAGRKTDAVAVELWFYRLAHVVDSWSQGLSQMWQLLERGARSRGRSFEANIARAKLDEHPNVTLLTSISRVVNGGLDPSELLQFPEWRRAGPSSSSAAGTNARTDSGGR